ncbi:MAG: methylated-DNA--[protein]-cysteine S-methyltransferase [Myxococcales bacterium]|nr:methylated-DNA--[protein]-cysteine S-methyltransferase [Myxococcota bacterium]MDW8281946.1 methylated-DNA--[protein]-cysteine S-methyltransferase [Myxococcales bacterium]
MSWITTQSAFEQAVAPEVPLRTWTQPSPLGTLLIATSPRGVALLTFNAHQREQQLRRVMDGYQAALLTPLLQEGREAHVADEIDAYLCGKLRRFTLNVDLTAVRAPFHRKVLTALCAVDYGQTTTYGQLARAVGRPGGARAVGQAVGMNPIAILVPCHRVLASDGSLGGYSAGLERKRMLLEIEGHRIIGSWPSGHA